MAISLDEATFIPGYGLDMSRGGVCLLSPVQVPDGNFTLRIMLHDRGFIVTAHKQHEAERQKDGKTWWTAFATDEDFREARVYRVGITR